MLQFVLTALILISSSFAAAKSNEWDIKIPVRLGFMAGYLGTNNSFKENRENKSMGGAVFGLDFSVPIKGSKVSLGMQGLLALPMKQEALTVNNMYLASLYVRYSGDYYDFFIGPGIGSMSAKTTMEDAAPETSKNTQTGTMGCGMTGLRFFFGKDIAGGIGLTGYYCATGSYRKTVVDNAMTSVETGVEEKASSAGGLVFLFLEWSDERTL